LRLEAEPSELLKALARLLVSEAARDNEPDRDLKSELFSVKPETEDREPLRALARPLT
jgi:hypothetical protein